MILCRLNAENQKQAVRYLLLSGQISIVLALVLGRFSFPWLPTHLIDFLCGFLSGYAIVAFLATLVCAGRPFTGGKS
jgi:hypothetical protein